MAKRASKTTAGSAGSKAKATGGAAKGAGAVKRRPTVQLVRDDPWLEPHESDIKRRMELYRQRCKAFEAEGGLMGQISRGHEYFGLNRGQRDGVAGVWYREWAPGARALALIGDFNDWDRAAHPMQRDEHGVWAVFLPDAEYADRLTHGSRVKVYVERADGKGQDRVPAYIRRAVQDEASKDFAGQYWQPAAYEWKHARPRADEPMRIYEAHVGMALEEARVGTWREFAEQVLGRVVELGYNTLQLMAVMEHPYYGSVGYQVSSFFAPSSRFGTPEELKALVDQAHGMGLRVIMDLVHSHAVLNEREGLRHFDGTDHQYSHAGGRGKHPAWDSMCFDYGKYEVQRFLLSNVRYWLEEFGFDGFRFDGVTSMLYVDHGLERQFNGLGDYYNENVDEQALVYLMLANDLAHQVDEQAVTIAEDMSGLPGIARRIGDGGVGFDYRLAMGVPDYWIKLLKHKRDEQWDMAELYHVLLNRRHDEKHVGYAESHDQAMVGDKTIAFRLMDADQYWHMSVFNRNLVVDRGIALHKMIRLVTFSLAGEAYLNFIGNEFGHPEWIDFPREGNGYSFDYARRQWSLVDRDDLLYKGLWRFDQAMQGLDREWALLGAREIERIDADEQRKVLVYRRGGLVFVFNFHPSESYEGLSVRVPEAKDYAQVLDSDAEQFSGHGRVEQGMVYPWQQGQAEERLVKMYLPSRTAQVLVPV